MQKVHHNRYRIRDNTLHYNIVEIYIMADNECNDNILRILNNFDANYMFLVLNLLTCTAVLLICRIVISMHQ